MPLHVRSISIRIAVLCLFVIAFVGWYKGLEPLVCCKRAVTGAVAIYIVTSILINITNRILIAAFIQSRVREQQEEVNPGGF